MENSQRGRLGLSCRTLLAPRDLAVFRFTGDQLVQPDGGGRRRRVRIRGFPWPHSEFFRGLRGRLSNSLRIVFLGSESSAIYYFLNGLASVVGRSACFCS